MVKGSLTVVGPKNWKLNLIITWMEEISGGSYNGENGTKEKKLP